MSSSSASSHNNTSGVSYLEEVLSSAEHVEFESIKKMTPLLISEVYNAEHELKRYVENVYVKLTEQPMRNKNLFVKADNLVNELRNTQTVIDKFSKKDVFRCAGNLDELATLLNQTEQKLDVITKVLKVHRCFKTIEQLQEKNLYKNAIDEIAAGLRVMDTISNEKYATARTTLTEALIEEKRLFSAKVLEVIKSNIKMDCGKMLNNQVNTLRIKPQNDEAQQALLGLEMCDSYIPYLHEVAQFLWESIFIPIVDGATEIDESEDEFHVLTVTVVKRQSKSFYKKIFTKLEIVLGFLKKRLPYQLQECSVLNYIGRDVQDNLSELIIKRCLQDTIPSTEKELAAYGSIIRDAESLQKQFTETGIFGKDTASIFEYANNVDKLFIDKQCQNHTKEAVAIMKKDLHDTVEVGEVSDPSVVLSDMDINFPHCLVSRSTVELLDLLENVLKYCTSCSEAFAGRLFCTVENIISIYAEFVLEHHKKLLQTIPQQIALFHNNCLYIAHEIHKWNEIYGESLSKVLGVKFPAFKLQSHPLKIIGTETFHSYIQEQLKQIDEILNESALSSIQTAENLDPSVEKSIRQCLRQQELLKTVWQKVLPYKTYNETFGLLLSRLCKHLIEDVLKAEDIQCNVAEQLVETFKVLLARGPKLFSDPKEVSLFVNNWYAINELVFVLSSGLIDICDRWADGKGPLALHFKAEDVRKLIKALFQNTDRRATALSKIA